MAALLKFWPIVIVALNVFVAWVCWSLRQLAKNEVTRLVDASEGRLFAKDAEMDARLDEHHDRLMKAEGHIGEIRADIDQLPTKSDLTRVEEGLKAVGREVAAVNAGVGRLEGYFLKRGVDGVAG